MGLQSRPLACVLTACIRDGAAGRRVCDAGTGQDAYPLPVAERGVGRHGLRRCVLRVPQKHPCIHHIGDQPPTDAQSWAPISASTLTPTPALMPTLTLDPRRQVLSHRLRIRPRGQVVAPRHPDHRGAGTAQINCTGTGTDHPNCCIIADTCPSHIDKPTLATSPSLATNLSPQAKKVYEVEQTDICASQYAYHDRGYVHEFQANTVASSFLQRF